jgi:hypothetical protein
MAVSGSPPSSGLVFSFLWMKNKDFGNHIVSCAAYGNNARDNLFQEALAAD